MIHPLLRLWVRISTWFFFDKIVISGKENLPVGCPVLFASNHPNSFLDSLVMTITVGRSLHYTARGDIFNSKIASVLLRYIQILPLFRMEEGKENLYKNEMTFSNCMEVLKKNGAVSIFSEGSCENEWDLRPLRKGTARLAYEAWNNPNIGDKLKIVPVAINYSSWHKTKPTIYISFLKNIEKNSFIRMDPFGTGIDSGQFNKKFNDELMSILSEKCIVVDKSSNITSQNKIAGFILKNFPDGVTTAKQLQAQYLLPPNETFKTDYKLLADFLMKEKIDYYPYSLSLIPYSPSERFIRAGLSPLVFAVAYILNALPYYLSKFIVHKITKDTVYHDSILCFTLMIIYPLYLAGLLIAMPYKLLAIGFLLLTVVSALQYENSKRNIQCFLKRDKLKVVRELLYRLFISNSF